MKKNKIAYYVMGYKRANACFSLDLLLKEGYSENVFLVLQDDEEQMEEYRRKYDKYILEYNKREQMLKSEAMDNFQVETSALYPRLFVLNHARENGFKYAVLLDDDIKSLSVRYPDGGKLKSCPVSFSNVEKVFTDYLDSVPTISALSGRFSSGYIGGLRTFKKGFNPFPTQMYFLNIDRCIDFRGSKFEDGLFALDNWKNGHPCMALYLIQMNTPQSQINEGGLHEEYLRTNDYILNFYVVMAYPFIPITFKKGKIGIMRNQDKCYPKIISSRWKK